MLEPLIPSTSAIPYVSLRILMILDSISGRLRSTRRLWHLLRNFFCVTKNIMKPDDIINYDSLVQEDMREYRVIFESNQWEPTDSKKKYKYEPLLLKAPSHNIIGLIKISCLCTCVHEYVSTSS